MNKKVWIPVVVAVAIVGVVIGSRLHRGGSQPETVRVGAVLALTGEFANFGQEQRRALELAQERINSAGGVRGRRFEFVFEDSQGEASKGLSAVRKLIDVDNVPVTFVFQSTVINAVQPVTDKARVLLMAFAMDPQVAEASDLTFRVYPNMRQQTEVMLDYLRGSEAKRVGILFIQTPATQYVVPKLLIPGINSQGREVVEQVSFTKNDRDLSTHVAKLKASNPDTIVTLAHFIFIPAILKTLKEQAVLDRVRILGDLSYTFPLDVDRSLLEGVMFVAPRYALEDRSEGERSSFEREFKKRYGRFPGYDPVFFYDAALLLAEAMNRGGTSPTDIAEHLRSVKGYKGVSGEITIDENGDAVVAMEVGVFRSGRMERLRRTE